MINSIKNTSTYNNLNLQKEHFHAYLLYSNDKELNNEVALSFACSIVCKNSSACGVCASCKQFLANTHPDVIVVNQNSIKVEDANNIVSKLATLPIYSSKKVFVILNAENINEIAQNKLLKSIEEPTNSNVFIFTTTKTDKLLPTVLSRLNKVYVPKLTNEDNVLVAKELKEKGIDIFKYINTDLTLTQILNFEQNENYKKTIDGIKNLFINLKTTQDIPNLVSNLGDIDKNLFFALLQDVMLNALNDGNKFSAEINAIFNSTYTKKALAKCLPLIDEAHKKHSANVNFTYILDNLLFNILKEKFLCR